MSAPTTERPIEILMIEDNQGDVRLAQEALRDAKVWRSHSCATKAFIPPRHARI